MRCRVAGAYSHRRLLREVHGAGQRSGHAKYRRHNLQSEVQSSKGGGGWPAPAGCHRVGGLAGWQLVGWLVGYWCRVRNQWLWVGGVGWAAGRGHIHTSNCQFALTNYFTGTGSIFFVLLPSDNLWKVSSFYFLCDVALFGDFGGTLLALYF